MKYRFLIEQDVPFIHQAIKKMFHGQEEPLLPFTKVRLMKYLKHNNIQWDLSVGLFEGQKMLGFLLNGVDAWNSKLTAYDIGLGLTAKYQGKEFNNILFDQALPRLQERGVSQYLLEVDISDSKALIYYRHKGFKKERELVNVRVDIAPSSLPRKNASVTTRRMSQPDWQHWQHFWDWKPSWQTSTRTIEQTPFDIEIVGAYTGNSCVGYVIFYPDSGHIAQIAVDPQQRRDGIGTVLLGATWAKVDPGNLLQMRTIDAVARKTINFFEANEFKIFLRQYEMTLQL